MYSLARSTVRVTAAALLAACALLAASAHAAMPPDLYQRIQNAAAAWRTDVAAQQQMQQMSGNAHLAGVAAQMSRQVSSSLIAQAVMEAIARDPRNASDAMAAAVQAAPELREDITRNLTMAFPGLAATIRSAGQPPAPIAAAPVTAVPRTAAPPPLPADDELEQVAAEFGDPYADADPLEGFNRAMFSVNDFLDRWLMIPIAKTYRFIMPETLRHMGRNFFENLNEPVVAINDVLQGDFSRAGTSLGRLAINSTIGILGFFEVAERVDLKEHNADFGQTLHSYGAGSGPFLMLPLFGPSTVRDAVGTGVDSFLNPLTYLLDWETRLYLKASEIVVDREEVLDPVEQLREGSIDFYAAVRAAWFQKREAELRKEKATFGNNAASSPAAAPAR